MRTRTVSVVALAGATLLAACGGGGTSSQSASPAHPARARQATKTQATTTTVALRSTSLGEVLVDGQGRTLYGFTNDANGTSTCSGSCAQSWPPLTVSGAWTVGTGLDRATFHTVGAGSTLQLATAKWPLYRYAGDRQPGDTNGEGILGKWFAVRADGSLVKPAAASGASSPAPAMSGGGY